MNRRALLWLLAAVPLTVLGATPLSTASERVKAAHAVLATAPSDVTAQRAFLAAFPSNFPGFLAVFMPPDFDQLYDGHEYIYPLADIGKSLPKETMEKLLKIETRGKWDADAPNYLQDVTLTLANTDTNVFLASLARLKATEQLGVIAFLAAGIEGPHPAFITLALQVEHAGQLKLAKRMRKEAELSQAEADREHGR